MFFLAAFVLLSLQVSFFNADVQSLSAVHGAIALFASIDSFMMERLSCVTTPVFLLPLVYLLARPVRSGWARRYLDIIGVSVIVRMAMQFIGLNVLVFDSVSSRFILAAQLLFSLLYSLLVWGWINWRLDQVDSGRQSRLFLLI